MLKSIIVFALSNIIVLYMFSVGLAARPEDFRQVAQRPALYGRALAVVLVAVPLVAYALARLFRLPPVAAGALVLTAICPGAPLLLKQARSLNASPTTSLNLLLLLTVCTLVTVPLWLRSPPPWLPPVALLPETVLLVMVSVPPSLRRPAPPAAM